MPNRKLREIVADQTLIQAAPDETVGDVASRMQGEHVGAVLILRDSSLEGIFTGSNLMKNVLEPGLNPQLVEVGEVMTPDPVCLDGEALGFDAVRAMRDYDIRHVVVRVSDADGDRYGMVSVRDFPTPEMAEFADEFDFETRVWEQM